MDNHDTDILLQISNTMGELKAGMLVNAAHNDATKDALARIETKFDGEVSEIKVEVKGHSEFISWVKGTGKLLVIGAAGVSIVSVAWAYGSNL